MNKKIVFILVLILSGCDASDGKEKLNYERFRNDPKLSVMAKAQQKLPLDLDIRSYRHVHYNSIEADKIRQLTNIENYLSNDQIKALSISCDNYLECEKQIEYMLNKLEINLEGKLILSTIDSPGFALEFKSKGAKYELLK
ncbi:MAG: hypothetical protein ACRBCS_01675 [Cellvibrionaceae bacterium]